MLLQSESILILHLVAISLQKLSLKRLLCSFSLTDTAMHKLTLSAFENQRSTHSVSYQELETISRIEGEAKTECWPFCMSMYRMRKAPLLLLRVRQCPHRWGWWERTRHRASYQHHLPRSSKPSGKPPLKDPQGCSHCYYSGFLFVLFCSLYCQHSRSTNSLAHSKTEAYELQNTLIT